MCWRKLRSRCFSIGDDPGPAGNVTTSLSENAFSRESTKVRCASVGHDDLATHKVVMCAAVAVCARLGESMDEGAVFLCRRFETVAYNVVLGVALPPPGHGRSRGNFDGGGGKFVVTNGDGTHPHHRFTGVEPGTHDQRPSPDDHSYRDESGECYSAAGNATRPG